MLTGTRYQLSLASLLETVFCLAVGLSATVKPVDFTTVDDPTNPIYWLGVLWQLALTTVACSLIFGLVRQVRIYRNSSGENKVTNTQQQFSISLALWGRRLLIIVLALCLIHKIVVTQGLITLTTSTFRDVYHGWYDPLLSNDLFLLAIFISMTFNKPSCTENPRAKKHPMLITLWSVAGILFVVIALRELALITYLTFIAIGGIENAQAGEYHRAGAYINHVAEGHRFFWAACGGLCSLLVGATSWLIALTREKLADRRGFVIVGALGLGLAATYASWYFTVGYPTLSPEFGEVGFQSRAAHWLNAGVIVALLIPFVAYRLAAKQDFTPQEENPLTHLQLSFPLGVGMLIFGAIGGVCELFIIIYNYLINRDFGMFDLAHYTRDMLLDANIYLSIAVICVIWMTLCHMWREKDATSSITVPIVDQKQFALACLALVIIIPVAIPTIAAFSFASWFNPWFI